MEDNDAFTDYLYERQDELGMGLTKHDVAVLWYIIDEYRQGCKLLEKQDGKIVRI